MKDIVTCFLLKNPFNLMVGVCVLFLAVLPLSALSQSQPSSAKGPVEAVVDNTPATSASPNWLVNCTNTGTSQSLNCEMSQSVVMSESGLRLLTATVQAGDGSSAPSLLLVLPHGLYLPAGVALAVDNGERNSLSIETCDTERGAISA